MIEKTVLDYLTINLDIPVYLERPEKPPDRYVLIEKTGSSRRNYCFVALFAIQSYGPSMVDVIELNENVKNVMYRIDELNGVGGVELANDYNFTDTQMKNYRYQAVFELTHY